MRGYISVKDNQKDEYLDKFFNAYWRDNVDLSSEKEFSKLLKIIKQQAYFKILNTTCLHY